MYGGKQERSPERGQENEWKYAVVGVGAEGTSTIYLDNHTCINQLYNYYDSWQEMKLVYQLNDYDWQKDWDEAHFSNFSMVKWLGKPVPWAHLDDAISEIDDSLEYRNESGNLFFFEEC